MRWIKIALVYEMRLWRSLFRWITRRPAVPPGASPFGYAGATAMVMWVFIVLSAIEIPIVHLMLPWDSARGGLLVVGAYGLLWMFGLLSSMRVYPHLVSEDGLRVRYGFSTDVHVPWSAVESIRFRRHSLPPGPKTVYEDGVLTMTQTHHSSVDVVLREPLTLPVKQATGPVRELRFYADEPEALVAKAKQHLAKALT